MDPTTTQGTTAGTPPVESLPNNFVGSATGQPMTAPATPPPAPVAPAPVSPAKPAVASPRMPDESLTARLERARRTERERVLKELGISDPADAKAKLAAFEELKAKQDQANREKMSREEQLQADLEREREARKDLETKLKEEATSRVYDKQEQLVLDIARKHIDATKPKLAAARMGFAEYVEELPKSQVARLTERDIDRWFAKFARENPDFAPKQPAPAAPPSTVRKPISTTTPAARSKPAPAPAPTNTDPTVNPQGKTFKPGQANSMSKAEVSAELKRRGMRGWR